MSWRCSVFPRMVRCDETWPWGTAGNHAKKCSSCSLDDGVMSESRNGSTRNQRVRIAAQVCMSAYAHFCDRSGVSSIEILGAGVAWQTLGGSHEDIWMVLHRQPASEWSV